MFTSSSSSVSFKFHRLPGINLKYNTLVIGKIVATNEVCDPLWSTEFILRAGQLFDVYAE